MGFDKRLKLYETAPIFSQKNYSGSVQSLIQLLGGSKLIMTISVHKVAPGAKITLTTMNGFSEDDLIQVDQQVITRPLNRKIVLNDMHNVFQFQAVTAGGNVDFDVGVTASIGV